VLAEFAAPSVPLTYANADGSWSDTTIGELLPLSFDAHALDVARGTD
jgi:cytidine deaminase